MRLSTYERTKKMANFWCLGGMATLLVALALTLVGSGAQLVSSQDSYDASEVIDKTAAELLNLRGYRSEVHTVRTDDGYLLQLVRVVNPKLVDGPTKRPVIFNHGLIESATIFLINSRDVTEAEDWSVCQPNYLNVIHSTNHTFYRSGPLMLSNWGYDVYLLSMRGTDFSKRHVTLDPSSPAFWDYSLDDFAFHDVPATIDYVRQLTKADKIGYVGHSQATLSMFNLLAWRPKYTSVLEPVVMIAPVSTITHIKSILNPIITTLTTLTSNRERGWELNGPFPFNAKRARQMSYNMCHRRSRDLMCHMLNELVSGKGDPWHRGYWSQVPYHTSLKVLRHFYQLHEAKRAQRYDYGTRKNLIIYNQPTPPAHPLENIRSKSIVLIYCVSDILATLEDIKHLKTKLRVPIYKDILIARDTFNHFDLLTSPEAANLVFKPMLEVFESFENSKDGRCSVSSQLQQWLD